MARGDIVKAQPLVPAAPSANPEVREGSRLSTMPLAVLLPRLSDVSQLPQFSAMFSERLEAIVEGRESADEDESKERAAEESMLRQLLQWLAVSQSG